MNEQQSAQRQFIVDMMNHGCGFGKLRAKPSGHDNGDGRISCRRQFGLYPGEQSFDHTEITPEHPGLHCAYGPASDDRRRPHDVDLGKLSRHTVKRIQRKTGPGRNDAATEGPIGIDHVERRSRTDIDDDQR